MEGVGLATAVAMLVGVGLASLVCGPVKIMNFNTEPHNIESATAGL